jgi:dUTP pyrophosphatase
MELEPGYEAQIRPRSGLAKDFAVTVLNAPGTVDEDFRGIIGVILINHSKYVVNISHHDRIAQMVICSLPIVRTREVEVLSATKRGEGGFGSTGTKSS